MNIKKMVLMVGIGLCGLTAFYVYSDRCGAGLLSPA